MEEAQRWSATYTNHVKQKRKVYHDGFLVLQSSRNKVMLYDECDKLLDTRFVKKDDIIKSGETITFDSHLVDLGELCRGHQPTVDLNSQEKGNKVSETSNSFYSYNSQNKRPMVGKSKRRVVNLSPSQKMIRDCKTSEMNKFGSSPNCMDMTQLSAKVLLSRMAGPVHNKNNTKGKEISRWLSTAYTRGSQARQVKLYDTNRRHLEGRFLKKDEIVRSGESLVLEGHLVEIGEQVEDHKPPTDLNVPGKSCKVVGKYDMTDYQDKIPSNKKLPAGKPRGDSSEGTLTKLSHSSYNYKAENAKLSRGDAEPRRSVCDILSILRQPSGRKVVPMNKPLCQDYADSHSSEIQSDIKNGIKEYAEECSGSAREELGEKRSEHDGMTKVIKSEPVEVEVDAEESRVSENGRVSQARSSGLHLRSRTMKFRSPIHNVQCTNLDKLTSSSSSMESHAAVNAALSCDGQKDIVSESPTRSYANEELENPPIICSCEKIVTKTNAALATALSSSKLPELQEDKNGSSSRCNDDCTSQNLNTEDMDEFPSFDLGI